MGSIEGISADQVSLCLELPYAINPFVSRISISASMDFRLSSVQGCKRARNASIRFVSTHAYGFSLFCRINSTLLVNAEVIKNYSIPIQASLTWPSLVEQSVRFPPTHIGNFTEQTLTLTNPADVPVLVQILPLVIYPHPNGAMDLVSDR